MTSHKVRVSRERVTASVRFEDYIHEALEVLRCNLETRAKTAIPGAKVTISEVVRMLVIEGLERHGALERR